jgi:hypothetical protein
MKNKVKKVLIIPLALVLLAGILILPGCEDGDSTMACETYTGLTFTEQMNIASHHLTFTERYDGNDSGLLNPGVIGNACMNASKSTIKNAVTNNNNYIKILSKSTGVRYNEMFKWK